MKISGSWASLLRGVSQQAPEVRQSGQHGEQVNMLSDPIAGLTRRQGTRRKATADLLASAPVGGNDLVAQGYRKVPHVTSGKDYVLWMREFNADPAFNKDTHLPPLICYNKTDNTFHPIDWADSVTALAGGYMGQFGVTAAVSLGKFFVFAVKSKLTTMTTDIRWIASGDFTTTARAIIWVRGGAFDRTYAVTLASGAVASFTTPAAGDTVTPPAASQISPQYIAQKLADALTTLGFTVTRNGAHIMSATAQSISVSDGGDGSLIRGSYTTLDGIDKLPIMGMHGQIIRIQAGPDSFFYVEAIAKTGQTGILTEVRWVECAGEAQASGINHFYIGTVTDANTIRLSPHPAVLNVPNPPVVVKSTAGDRTSNPAHSFLRGRQITYLGMFQDRLMIGAGAALAASAAGDYFNWFRSTMLTVPAKDSFEMIAQGGEDDFLRHSVPYSKNLVVFGDKRQYIIGGTQQLTPLTVNMAVMTTYADAATTPAVAAGGQIYYGRDREGNVGIHQIQPGSFVDSAESFPASSQIGNYITAPVAQIEVVPGAPSHLLVRTRAKPRSIFTFSYLDQPDGRKQDAWSRWDFHPSIGACVGVDSTPNGVLVFWTRQSGSGNWIVVADLLPMATGLTDVPFFDSARPYAEDHVVPDPDEWVVAFNGQSERFLIGGGLDEVADLIAEYPTEESKLWLGLPFESYVIPTNPYTRDGKGLAILTGRTVVTNYSVNMRNSSGMITTVTTKNGSKVFDFNARVLGDVANMIGIVPVSSGVHNVPIGREVREFEVKLAARKWYPFTLIGMEWTGQSFNRTPRA